MTSLFFKQLKHLQRLMRIMLIKKWRKKIGWHAENLKMKDFHKFLLFHVRYL